ncbi:hypothetical protein K1719_029765 [Acacia pycnantha]|nr:hypothetical protein K1719_029765 [Acacia pycnantha]
MSMFLVNCRKVDDPEALPTIVSFDRKKSSRWDWRKLWGFVVLLWFCVIFSIEFVLRCLWVRDRRTVLSGGAGVEDWPRTMATAKFRLEDMKVLKKAVTNALSFPARVFHFTSWKMQMGYAGLFIEN